VIHLRELPDAPETFYLMDLMASHDFQTGLQNYLDLEDMRKKLVAWQTSLDSFEDIVHLRQQYYEPLLPEIDRQFRKLDAQMRLRLEQRKHVEQRLQQMLIAPRPDYLLKADERLLESQIDRLEAAVEIAGDPGAALRPRIRRLKGALLWNVETQYPARLTEAHEHLRDLNADIDRLTAQYDAFVRTRQAATHSYVGYEGPIDGLRGRIGEALERLGVLMAQQGHMLEVVASRELFARRERLETYLNQARFAFADSYDRAAKAQAK
jgi:outer membrane murein-binding lipoprotein Lpp